MRNTLMKMIIIFALALIGILCLLHNLLTPAILIRELGGDDKETIKISKPYGSNCLLSKHNVYLCGPQANSMHTKAIAINERAELCEFLLDQQNNEPKLIAKVGKEGDVFRHIRYGTSDNEVSYVRNDCLYLYDIKQNKEILIVEFSKGVDASYSWVDSSHLVYRDNLRLVIYDTKEKKEEEWISLDLCINSSEVAWECQQSFEISFARNVIAYIDRNGNLHKAQFDKDGQIISDYILKRSNGMYPIKFQIRDSTIIFSVTENKRLSFLNQPIYKVYINQFGFNRRIYESKEGIMVASLSLA